VNFRDRQLAELKNGLERDAFVLSSYVQSKLEDPNAGELSTIAINYSQETEGRVVIIAADGEVLRHPEWGGWVHWDALRRQWVAQTRNGVGRTSANVVDVLRRAHMHVDVASVESDGAAPVVCARGLRLLPGQVIVRNLLRVVDMFPVFYAVGGGFALFSKRCQRLGDLAAGTVVVRTVKVIPPDVEAVLGGKYNSFRQHAHLEARLRQKVTPEEAQLALAALVRRDELDTDAAIKVFGEMATRFREKVKFPEETEFGLTDEQYVRNAVDTLYRKAGG
jgi:hypothetical protein